MKKIIYLSITAITLGASSFDVLGLGLKAQQLGGHVQINLEELGIDPSIVRSATPQLVNQVKSWFSEKKNIQDNVVIFNDIPLIAEALSKNPQNLKELGVDIKDKNGVIEILRALKNNTHVELLAISSKLAPDVIPSVARELEGNSSLKSLSFSINGTSDMMDTIATTFKSCKSSCKVDIQFEDLDWPVSFTCQNAE